MKRNLKISFDPTLPGEAWQMGYTKNGLRRRIGQSFPGQWIVFDRAEVPMFRHPTRDQILFRASVSDACFDWIERCRLAEEITP